MSRFKLCHKIYQTVVLLLTQMGVLNKDSSSVNIVYFFQPQQADFNQSITSPIGSLGGLVKSLNWKREFNRDRLIMHSHH